MGFLKNLFAKASTIDRLTDERNYLQSCLDRETYKNVELNKEIKSERRRVDKIILTYADQISQKNGLYAKFEKSVASLEPKKDEPPEPVSERITWAAEKQREADIDAGLEPETLEYYIKAIQAEPERYIL